MSKESEIMREHIRTHRTVLSMCNEPEDVVLNRLLDDFDSKDQRIAELEEQLKNAIVPKFKIGQEVWFVRYFNAGCYEFDYGKVIQIKITEYDGIFYEMEYLNKCEIDFRSRHEKYVFATKEEAEAKLEELKGENK